MYDLIILGGGPAGLTAAAYALHKRLETLLISEDLGGKTNYRFRAPWMEGYEWITGTEIVNRFKSQLEYLNFAHENDRATQVTRNDKTFTVTTAKGKTFETRALIVATGTTPNRLAVAGEPQLIGRGLSYSALSHAPLFIDRNVALVGKGPVALRAAAELALVARNVTFVTMDQKDLFTPLGRKLGANPKVKIMNGFHVQAVTGEQYVNGLILTHNGSGPDKLTLDGVFVEMGTKPNVEMLGDLVKLDEQNRVMVDARAKTSVPGVFAAGDVSDTYGEQVLIAIGEGAKAALSAYEYLLED